MVVFYSRSDWGAVPATAGPGALTPSRVVGIALHWPAMQSPIGTVVGVKAALRSWQRYHMQDKGWSDIAYQEAIDQDGNVYELRGLRTQSGANGDALTNETYGSLLLVLAPGEQPSSALVDAVRGRVAAHRGLFAGSKVVVGHNDIRPEPTACPGPVVSAGIKVGLFEPKPPAPAPEPGHVPVSVPKSLVQRARRLLTRAARNAEKAGRVERADRIRGARDGLPKK